MTSSGVLNVGEYEEYHVLSRLFRSFASQTIHIRLRPGVHHERCDQEVSVTPYYPDATFQQTLKTMIR